MSYKLKQESIEVFSKDISTAICNKFFKVNDKIDGNQLMSITGSNQTNLLLIKVLFDKWQLEMAKLESPYFAFEKEEVKTALDAFMKVLSKHIQIDRSHFEPILTSAIQASISLHFNSAEFYKKHLISDTKKDLLIEELIGLKKYLKFNSAPFFKMLNDFDGEQITRDQLNDLVQSTYSKSDITSIDAEDFLAELEAVDKMELLFEKEIEVLVEVVEEVIPPEITQTEEKPDKIKLIADEDEFAPGLNHKFEKPISTLADQLKKKVKKDIESSLNLNEKFMFIDNLFGGNSVAFKEALKDLESSTDFNHAKSKIESGYGYEWDMNGEEVEALIEVLERRFV